MNELGMIVDVSHMSDGGFWDMVSHSKAPVVASHSSSRSLCNHPRNMTDEMLKALAEKGGVAAVNFYPAFVRENERAMREDLAAHIQHIVNVAGMDAVAIGTDFDGFTGGSLEIDKVEKMPILYRIATGRFYRRTDGKNMVSECNEGNQRCDAIRKQCVSFGGYTLFSL